MTAVDPGPGSLQRGDVVLASDPFTEDDDAARPWAVVNNERHPFDGEQYVAMALTTRTWYDERIPLGDGDFLEGRTSEESSIVPHALASLGPTRITDYVCRLSARPIDDAVHQLHTYLVATD
jgi:mRNA-degrading endonuclease toxin of MazEF toxin-antitoxin module